MAAALPGLADRMVALLEGTATGVDRSIAAGTFKHTPYNPNSLWAPSAQAPYPFEIVDSGIAQPLDTPSTMAASQIWHGATLNIRVGFVTNVHDAYEWMQQIETYRYQIRRCLNDPVSWGNTTGFSKVEVFEGDILEEDIEGSDEDGNPTPMWVLEMPVNLTFREDHS
jgi:hypothetical protein